MSQFFVQAPSSSFNAITSFSTDFYIQAGNFVAGGTVLPVANNVIIRGATSERWNPIGIETVVDPNNSNNLEIELTNRILVDTLVTPPGNNLILTFPLDSSPRAYRIILEIISRGPSGSSGLTLSITASTDGTNSTIISEPDQDADRDRLVDEVSVIANANTIEVFYSANEVTATSIIGYYVKV